MGQVVQPSRRPRGPPSVRASPAVRCRRVAPGPGPSAPPAAVAAVPGLTRAGSRTAIPAMSGRRIQAVRSSPQTTPAARLPAQRRSGCLLRPYFRSVFAGPRRRHLRATRAAVSRVSTVLASKEPSSCPLQYLPEQWAALPPAPGPAPARTYTERRNYPSFTGIAVAALLIPIPIVGWVALVILIFMLARYLFGYRSPGSPQWSIHHPSVTSLAVVRVVAVCTVVAYPLAIYMSWSACSSSNKIASDTSRRSARAAPRRLEAAALVCRHCGQEFDTIPNPAAATLA